MNNKSQPRIAIIGAGPSGIASGNELLKQGFTNFVIYEKSTAAGGTWHNQNYPGLACDVWAHSYSFSDAPNPNWSEVFVSHTEIASYLQKCVNDFGLEPHMLLQQKVISAHFENNNTWALNIEDNEKNIRTEIFDTVINAMGNQHTPVFPNIIGIQPDGTDVFEGESWHSTNWRHDVDLKNKNVIVIGSAAAAIQIVPEIAKQVKHLTVMQRSANWILPRNNSPYSELTIKLFNRLPFLMKALQTIQSSLMSLVYGAVTNDSRMMKTFENIGRKLIEKNFEDPEMRKAVTPDYRYGCKRPLVSDDFYPALNRDNVTLKHTGAKKITSTGIETEEGERIDADVIIYCTGYRILDFDRIEVLGKDKRNLAEEMEVAPEVYKGITILGYPNYFLAVGPNAVVISVSYYKSIEGNVKNIVALLNEMRDKNVKAIDVKPELNRKYNDWVIENCKNFSWGSGACNTYYVNESGRSPFLYPANYKSFLKMRAECTIKDFIEIK